MHVGGEYAPPTIYYIHVKLVHEQKLMIESMAVTSFIELDH